MTTDELRAVVESMGKEISEMIGDKFKINDDFSGITEEAMDMFDENFFSVAGVTHEELGKLSFDIHHNPGFSHLTMHVPPLTIYASVFTNGFLLACYLVRMKQQGVDIGEMDADLLVKDFDAWLDEIPDFKSEQAAASSLKEEDLEPPDDSDLDDASSF